MTPALSITLETAVPLHIAELANTSTATKASIARDCADELAARGDVLQFGGRGCAQAFNALARGLAAAAYQPGGVTFAGQHWCVNHSACQQTEEATR